MEQIMGLISKASVILAFVFISTLIGENFDYKKRKWDCSQILQGVIFCAFIFIDIRTPYISSNDISYDAREVLLNLAAAVYGPIAATITAGFTFVIRWMRGTKGTEIALAGIALVYFLEMFFIYWLHAKNQAFNSARLFLMSLLTNLLSALTVVLMSGSEWQYALMPGLTFIAAYPVFTVVAFRIMQYIRNRSELLNQLSERDKSLYQKNRELQLANEELRRNERHFRTMFYYSSEAIFLLREDRISDVNLEALKLLGQDSKEQMLGKSLYYFMAELQQERSAKDYMEDIFQQLESGKAIQKEICFLLPNGAQLLSEGVFIEIEMGEKKYTYLSARDIRERKRQEEAILYKAQYDELTKVANRQYFNEMLKKLSADENNYPIAFMMADINGLKLMNDIFGHSKGDELILKVAQVLCQSCRNRDLIARIGGDEFVGIFPNADEKAIEVVINRIQERLAQEKIENLSPSVSMGYSIKRSMDDDADKVLVLADEMMYRNKNESRHIQMEMFLKNISDKLQQKSAGLDLKQAEEIDRLISKLKASGALTDSLIEELKRLECSA